MKSTIRKRFYHSIMGLMITVAGISQSPPVTTIGTATFSAGVYSVPVTVTGFQNVGSISLTINYDNTKLAYAGAVLNAGLNSASPVSTPVSDQSGKFRMSATSIAPITLAAPAGTLLTLTFTALPGIQGIQTPLTWSTGQGDCDITPPYPLSYNPPVSTSNLSTYFINGFINILPDITVSLKLFIEGLYTGAGLMRKAQGAAGDQFPGTVADKITVELHDAASYATLILTVPDISLLTDGTAVFTVPSIYNLSYYITIRHRNSIATVSASPVSLAIPAVNYDFSTQATQAFGGNLKNSGGVFLIYSGDPIQDGFVGVIDMSGVDNLSAIFAMGYLPEDINGDGYVGVTDMSVIDNNSANFVGAITP